MRVYQLLDIVRDQRTRIEPLKIDAFVVSSSAGGLKLYIGFWREPLNIGEWANTESTACLLVSRSDDLRVLGTNTGIGLH